MTDHTKRHRWSGWPGAVCLVCGSEDPQEVALGYGWLSLSPDGNSMAFDTDEHREWVVNANICKGAPKMRILFLDDDPRRHELFVRLTGPLGHMIHTAKDYGGAIDQMQRHDFDIVYLDHDLSMDAIMRDPSEVKELTGSDVAKWIVGARPKVQHIVLHSMNPAGALNMERILSELPATSVTKRPFHLLVTDWRDWSASD